MTKQKKTFKASEISSIEISYFTPDLPPPYCYNYLLNATIAEDGLTISFKLEYVDREELDEEDILAEGFTMTDDFEYTGILPNVWKRELIAQLERTTFSKGNSGDYPIHLKLIDKDTKIYEGYPSDLNNWDYFLHELVQGIFEAGKKERPLEIIYRSIDVKRQLEEIVLNVSFLSRKATKSTETGGKKYETDVSFRDLKKILKAVYMPDYHQEKAITKSPDKTGKYINLGNGLWYEFGKSALNPDPAFDSLQKAERLLRNDL